MKKNKETTNIDAVVLWVDNNDPKWQEDAIKYDPNFLDTPQRFRDWGTLKYWFRAIEKNAPWIRKIHFVTYGHVPDWLDTTNPKINIVKHEDFIPKEYLPTFNSNAIEINLHRIKDLSENFLLFNDDVLVLNKIQPTDFFKNGKIVDALIEAPIAPTDDIFQQTLFNNLSIINRYYTKDTKKLRKKTTCLKYGKYAIMSLIESKHSNFVGFYNQHIAAFFFKSSYEKLWQLEPILCENTSKSKFRSKDNITQHLIQYMQLLDKDFIPRKISFGKNIDLTSTISLNDLKKAAYKVVCFNDGNNIIDFSMRKNELLKLLDSKFPNKSEFEK